MSSGPGTGQDNNLLCIFQQTYQLYSKVLCFGKYHWLLGQNSNKPKKIRNRLNRKCNLVVWLNISDTRLDKASIHFYSNLILNLHRILKYNLPRLYRLSRYNLIKYNLSSIHSIDLLNFQSKICNLQSMLSIHLIHRLRMYLLHFNNLVNILIHLNSILRHSYCIH